MNYADRTRKIDGLPSLKSLRGRYGDCPAVILGGGTTLMADYEGTPACSLVISVNHYADVLDIDCDYIVFCDDPYKHPAILKAKQRYHGKAISTYQPWADFDLDVQPYCDGMSLTTALWLADYITAGKIYLCGIDCNTTYPTHINGRHDRRMFDTTLEHKTRPILNMLDNVVDHRKIVALQEPLKGIIDAWGKDARSDTG